MADITLDPADVSADGLTIPLDRFKGKGRLDVGRTVTLGTDAGVPSDWEVLRVGEGVVHLVRSDRAKWLKGEHRKIGHRDDGSIEPV